MRWCEANGLKPIVPSHASREYELLHSTPRFDREGVQVAQMPYRFLLGKTLPVFVASRTMPVVPTVLDRADVEVMEKALGLADEVKGKVYLATADYDMPFAIRAYDSQRRVVVATPDSVEKGLAHRVPALGLGILIKTSVLADLERISSGELKNDGKPYIAVARREPFTYGGRHFRLDTAMEVRFKGGKMRSEARRYDMPVMVADAATDAVLGRTSDYKAQNTEFGKFAEEIGDMPEGVAVVSPRNKNFLTILQRAIEKKDALSHFRRLLFVNQHADNPSVVARVKIDAGMDLKSPDHRERTLYTLGEIIRRNYKAIDCARIRPF